METKKQTPENEKINVKKQTVEEREIAKKGHHATANAAFNHPIHFIQGHGRRNKSFGSSHEPGTV